MASSSKSPTMDNSKPKTTLKDSAIIVIDKKTISDQQTNTRAFPGSDNYVWGYTYYPARNPIGEGIKNNHVRLSVTWTPAAEGRVTIEAAGLPLKKSEFSKCQRVDTFYLHHNDLLTAMDKDLWLQCTVEIDVDDVPEIDQAPEIHKTAPAVKIPRKGSGLRSLELTDKLQILESVKGDITFDLYRQMDEIKWYRSPELRHILHDSNDYRWTVDYVGDGLWKRPVYINFELYQDGHIPLNGKLIVEADPFPMMTYPITKFFGGKLYFEHLAYNDVVNEINDDNILHFKFTLELTFIKDFVPEIGKEFLMFRKIQTEFNDYDEIPTDFEIHCGDDHYEVHKAVLSKISPVFKDMLENDLAETNSNKIEITDFDFATVEAVMNLCYGRPFDNINVKLGLDVLYFAAKYGIDDITTIFEKVLIDSLSITNFCAVLNYTTNCKRTDIFAECAKFYKNNEDAIKSTGTFLALPGRLINSLLKCAYNFETELEVFYHARQKGICLIEDVIDPSTVEIQTLTDFLQVVPYAWKYHTEGLKLNCAQFYQQNKAEVEKTDEYRDYSKTMQQALNVLGGRIEVRTDLRAYENIATDFAIQCGDNQIEVHKDVLSQISPVFEAMLRHNFIETSSNKIEINDFDFKTVEMAMNICYGRPCGKLSTEMVLDILYFADKYNFADVFTQLEEIPMHYLSVTNFCAVLRYATDLEKKTLFGECVAFFNINTEKLRTDVAALPVPLAMRLLKSAYHLETELETFLRARKNRIRLDIEELEVPTLADFFKTVPYAWEKYEDGLKMKCAKFWQENKNTVKTEEEYLSFSRSIKEELDVLGACFE